MDTIPMPKLPKSSSRCKNVDATITTTLEAVVTAVNDIKGQNDELMKVLAGNERLGQTGLIFKVQSIEASLGQLTKVLEHGNNVTASELTRLKLEIEAVKAEAAKVEVDVAKLKESQAEDDKEKDSLKNKLKGGSMVISVIIGAIGGLVSLGAWIFDHLPKTP